VITAPNGDIFVSDGHNGQGAGTPPAGSTGRILKFTSEGEFIKEWGEIGWAPGQFRTPHAMEFDSQGRLYVADRGNHRIQIFDQEGELLEIYTNYSRISGLFITDDDTLYAIDSESGVGNHPGWLTGVRIGPAGEDRLTGFIPPHAHDVRVLQGVAGEGVAVDADGNVYAAEGPGSRPTAGSGITKYVAQ
jgi:sugar lactone lactonase YvrE